MSKILELLAPILTKSVADVVERIGDLAEDRVREFASQLFVFQVITSVVATVAVFSCFSAMGLGWTLFYGVNAGSASLVLALLYTSIGFGAVSIGLLVFAIQKLKPEPPQRREEPNTIVVITEAAQSLALALIEDRRAAADNSAHQKRVQDLEDRTSELSEALTLLVRMQGNPEPMPLKDRETSLKG